MPNFIDMLLHNLRGPRGSDMRVLCRQLLSQRGEASQTVVARRIIEQYRTMSANQQLDFFRMLAVDFQPDKEAIAAAAGDFFREPNAAHRAALSAAVEAPSQELFRRINTGGSGTETLVAMRADLLRCMATHPELSVLEDDIRHLFRSWFNRGFLRLQRISWETPALILEKLIEYESVHEINGWPDLRRRLSGDRRCFAFFHPALPNDPVIFVEVALARGLARNLDPLLDISAPVLKPEHLNTAVFYSINSCLAGLRKIQFGNFLIKQVVDELQAELPRVKYYVTLSPLPRFAEALRGGNGEDAFTEQRLSRLLADFAGDLCPAGKSRDPITALTTLLQQASENRQILAAPLRRLALAYITQVRANGKPHDPVSLFHFSNGARLESINPFANLRRYGLLESHGVMVNYRYVPAEVEDNHERFVSSGSMRVTPALLHEKKVVGKLWRGEAGSSAGLRAKAAEEPGS